MLYFLMGVLCVTQVVSFIYLMWNDRKNTDDVAKVISEIYKYAEKNYAKKGDLPRRDPQSGEIILGKKL